MGQVFARAGELRDANGVLRTGNGEPLNDAPPRSLAPRRLVESEDPVVRSTPAPSHAVQVRKLACCSQRSDFVLACWLVQVARMFSVLSTTQKEWMATGWDEDYISKFKSAWGGL